MNKQDKARLVDGLTEEFKTSDAIIVCNYKGLNVKALELLRNRARDMDVRVQIIKNTLASIALDNAEKSGLTLKDTNIFIWGKDQLQVSKVVADFTKIASIFEIKSAFINNEVTDASRVVALSKLPSRNELIAMLLQVWNAPITNFTIGLDALKTKKEQSV